MRRKNLNKILMVSLLSCLSIYGGFKAYNANASPNSQVNVTVPSNVSVVFNGDGTNTISNYNITNNSLVPITVDNINLSSKNGWSIVPSGSKILRDTKSLSLSLFDKWLNEGDNNMSVVISEGSNRNLSPLVERGAWTKEVTESAFDLSISYNIGKKDFTLSFNPSGGNDVKSIVAKNGDSVTLPSASKKGYTFTGWLDSNGTIHSAGSSYTMPIGGDELVAQWRVNKLYIQYNMNGGSFIGSSDDRVSTNGDLMIFNNSTHVHTYSYGETMTSSGLADYNNNTFINISKTGYTALSGAQWNTKSDGSGTSYDQYAVYKVSDLADLSNGDVTLTLYVNWKPIKYTINFDGTYANSGSITSIKATYDSSITLPPNGFYKNAHTFTGWNTSSYGTGISYSNKQEVKNLCSNNGDVITLYAQWKPNDIRFSFKPENGENNYSLNGVLGDIYDLTPPTKDGYNFDGWGRSDYYGLFGKYVRKHTFEDGILDGIEVYKYGYFDSNLFGKLEMINSSADNPTSSNYEVKITATAPYTVYGLNRYVGFCTRGSITPGKSYVHTFKAKIPKGVKVEAAHNSLGDGGNIYWYTEQYGTGEWETYSYIAELGLNSDSQTVGYIYVDSIDSSAVSVPFSWNLAYSKIMEVTNVSTDPVLLLGSKDNTLTAKWTPIDYSITYNLDGGTVTGNPSSYNIDSETITLNKPTKVGHTFLGWREYQNPSGWYKGHVGENGPYEDPRYPDAIHSSPLQVKAGRTYYLDEYSQSDDTTIGFRYFSNDGDYQYITDYKNGFEVPKDGIVYILKHSLGKITTFEEFKQRATLNCDYVDTIDNGSYGNRGFYALWSVNTYYLDVSGYLDGKGTTNVTGYGTFDVYINGALVSQGASDYYKQIPYGTSYEIKNIQSTVGHNYVGVHSGSLKGTVNVGDNVVRLALNTNTYNVVYNANGGSGSTATSTHKYGEAKTLTPNGFSKTGYSFAGWATSASGSVAYSNGQSVTNLTATNNGTVNLYAKWTPNTNTKYTVNHYQMNLDGVNYTLKESESKTGTSDSSITISNLKKSYTGFTYVNGKVGSSVVTTTTVAADGSRVIDLYYSRNKYYLDVNGMLDGKSSSSLKDFNNITYATFDLYLNGSLFVSDAVDYCYGIYYGTPFEIVLKVPSGRNHTGFSSESYTHTSGGYLEAYNLLTGTITKGIVIRPTIDTVNYSITYNLNGGSISGQKTSYNVDTATFTLPTPSRTGYLFSGWTGSNGSTPQTSVSIVKGSTGNKSYTANWTPKKLTTTFYRNLNSSDTTTAQQSFTYGITGQSFSSKGWSKTGYTQLGWADSRTATTQQYSTLSGVSDGWIDSKYPSNNVYAIWKANTYNIAYNANGGTGTTATSSHTYGVAKTLTANAFTRTGYTFKGWNTKADGSGTSYTNSQSVSNLTSTNGSTVTLYAQWTANTYTYNIVYKSSTGKALGTSTVAGTFGSSKSVSAPAKTGYTTPSAQTVVFDSTSAKTITFTYPIVNYTISYNLNGGSVSGNPSSYNIESAAITLKNPSKTGNTFKGWTGSNGTTAQTSVSIPSGSIGNKSYTANWNVNSYTATFNGNGGSAGTSITKPYGSQLGTLPTSSRTGYTFRGWFTAASGGTQITATTTMPASNVTYYAQWTANTYTVNYNANGGTGTTASSSHTYGTAKALTTNGFSRTGYTFLGWSTSPSATTATYTNGQSVSNLSSTNGGTVTLYAVWKVNSYTLTFNPNGGTVSETSRKVAQGSPLGKLPVPTRPGYIFNGWFAYSYGGTQYTESSIMGSSDLTIYACWTQKTTTLIDGPSFNSTLLSMLGNCTKISFTSTSIPSNKISTAKIVSNSNSTNKAYMYVDGSTLFISPDESGVSLIAPVDCTTMFLNAKTVTTLDLSNFNLTTSTAIMKRMFQGMSSLTSLDVSKFKTSNVTDMMQTFQDCRSLTSLDVSKFSTSKVTTMNYMFYGCSSLKTLTLTPGVRPTFVTTSVTDMSFMFAGCNSLPTVNLSSFNTSKVTNMSSMFNGCLSLTSLNLANFNTSNVTSMSGMFADCRSLASLNLSSFTDYNVTNFSYMFSECINLSNLNISNMGLHKATTVREMFYNCPKLSTTVTVRGNPSNYLYMFKYTATASGSMVSVNYTSSTSALVLSMIDTKSPNSNVTLGFTVYSLDSDSSNEESNESVDGVLKPSDTLPNEQPSEELDNVVSTPQVDSNGEDELVDEPSSNVESGTSSDVENEPSSDVDDVPSEDVEEIPPTDNAEEIPSSDTIKTPSDGVPIDTPNEDIPSGNDS